MIKVRDLIAQLQSVDQDLYVLCYTEDENLLAKGHVFRLLEIDGVSVSEGRMDRDKNNVPTMKLGKGPDAVEFACLDVTSDF